jgi:hypothetical protein
MKNARVPIVRVRTAIAKIQISIAISHPRVGARAGAVGGVRGEPQKGQNDNPSWRNFLPHFGHVGSLEPMLSNSFNSSFLLRLTLD